MSYDKTDFHARTASLIFDVPIEYVSEKQRRAAKTYNYAIQYGASHTTAAVELMKEMGMGKFGKKTVHIPRYSQIFQQIAKSFEKFLKNFEILLTRVVSWIKMKLL